jgi:hypothetical protein
MKEQFYAYIQNLQDQIVAIFRMRKVLIFFVLFINCKNYSQISSLKKDSIAINNYIKAQNLQKKNPEILVIEDKKWVDLIRNYTNSKQKLIEDEILRNLKTESIGERFKGRYKSVDSEIISIIKQGNNDSIKKLYFELQDDFFNDKGKKIDQDLKTLFFESINNPALEVATTYLISSLKIEGYEKVIEDRLLSGKSTNEILLFSTLKDYDISRSIDYFTNSILNSEKYTDSKQIFNYTLKTTIDDMLYLSQHKTLENKEVGKKLLNFCIDLLKKYPLTPDIINKCSIASECRMSLNNGKDYDNQMDIVGILLRRGNSSVIPFLKQLRESGVENNIHFDFLFWKYGEDKSETTFSRLLSDYEYCFRTAEELDKQGLLFSDDRLMIKILSRHNTVLNTVCITMEKQYLSFLNTDQMINIFYKLNRNKFISILNNSIQSKDDINSLLEDYDRKNLSTIHCAVRNHKLSGNNLKNFFVIQYLLKKQKDDLVNSFMADIYDNKYKIFNAYDSEVDDLGDSFEIRNHLNVIRDFSNGELKSLTYYLDDKYMEYDGYSGSYDDFIENGIEANCYVYFNDVVYLMNTHRDSDVKNLILNKLSSKMLSRINSKNRFIAFDFWKDGKFFKKFSDNVYTFGNPEIVNGVLNKYDFKN